MYIYYYVNIFILQKFAIDNSTYCNCNIHLWNNCSCWWFSCLSSAEKEGETLLNKLCKVCFKKKRGQEEDHSQVTYIKSIQSKNIPLQVEVRRGY